MRTHKAPSSSLEIRNKPVHTKHLDLYTDSIFQKIEFVDKFIRTFSVVNYTENVRLSAFCFLSKLQTYIAYT